MTGAVNGAAALAGDGVPQAIARLAELLLDAVGASGMAARPGVLFSALGAVAGALARTSGDAAGCMAALNAFAAHTIERAPAEL